MIPCMIWLAWSARLLHRQRVAGKFKNSDKLVHGELLYIFFGSGQTLV